MAVKIELEEVTPKSFRLTHDKSFNVQVNGIPFCYLITTGEDYVLAWDGRVHFPTLEDEVFERLRLSIPLVVSGDRAIKEASRVSVLAADAKLTEFQLQKTDDDSALQRWLSNSYASREISFIRVDVGNTGELLDYSFSTENNPNSSENELALRLPRRVLVSGSLVGWVREHHQKPPRLERGDEYQIANVLNRYK